MPLDPYQTKAHEYFTTLADSRKPTWASAGWSTAITQERRWHVFASLYDFAGSTVLDVGAGAGGFRTFLGQIGVPPLTYVGLDLVKQNCERLAAEPGVNLAVNSTIDAIREFPCFDVVTASGIFNLDAADWPEYVASQLVSLGVRARCGVLVNVICPQQSWRALCEVMWSLQHEVREGASGDEREWAAFVSEASRPLRTDGVP